MAILNVRSVPATSDQNCDPKGAIRLINEHKKYQYASIDSSVLENEHTLWREWLHLAGVGNH